MSERFPEETPDWERRLEIEECGYLHEEPPAWAEARMTAAQEETLRTLCDRYGVQYAAEHYYVYPLDSTMMPGWAEGWLGGPRHANPEYARREEPAGKPSLYVGVDPEGRAHS